MNFVVTVEQLTMIGTNQIMYIETTDQNLQLLLPNYALLDLGLNNYLYLFLI